MPPQPKKFIIPKRKQESLVDFMMMKTEEVMAKFLTLPNATRIGEGDRSAVYVPATKEKSVLLVAHADTVWNKGNAEIKIGFCDGALESLQENIGIGADDRAGIAMLWKLRNTGHALIIPNMEESGCIGARFVMEQEEWRKRINSHLFAIEMDRMHASDLAFYDVASLDFKDYCEKEFPEYKRQFGSFTDIRVLCDSDLHKEDALCGVNISIGYYGQHGAGERLVISEWQRTLSYLHKLLTKDDLPSFKHKYYERSYNYGYQGGNNYAYDGYGYDYAGYQPKERSFSVPLLPQRNSNIKGLDSMLVCPSVACQGMFDESEYRSLGNKCPYCKETF